MSPAAVCASWLSFAAAICAPFCASRAFVLALRPLYSCCCSSLVSPYCGPASASTIPFPMALPRAIALMRRRTHGGAAALVFQSFSRCGGRQNGASFPEDPDVRFSAPTAAAAGGLLQRAAPCLSCMALPGSTGRYTEAGGPADAGPPLGG